MEREGLFLTPWVYEVADCPGIVGGLLLSELLKALKANENDDEDE